jgi:phosphatidylserine/phosphatidylglycerophosphate/cardiolipin synthase-like enzyme
LKLLVSLVLILVVFSGCYLPQSVPNDIGKKVFEGVSAGAITESSNISTYFSKQGQHPDTVLVNLYNQAQSTLDIAIYSLTYAPIVDGIIKAKQRGIPVRVITDKQQAGGASNVVAIRILKQNNIPIKYDNHSGLMHLKMSIIDNKIATTGSYNYSKGATEDNDEMLVVINDVGFAQKCTGEFSRMWNDLVHYVNIP